MIKSLNKTDILNSPFVAKKSWRTQNVYLEDVLLWVSGSLSGSLAYEFIDHGDGTDSPITNSYCALAPIQQDALYINYQAGINISGTFYPSSSTYYNQSINDVNLDKTYKNIIYNTNKQLFYNKYNNPVQLFGIENLDLSVTNRILTDTMDVFSIPMDHFGDKIIPNSISIVDESLDETYNIVDDGNCNLILSGSHFSKYQVSSLEPTNDIECVPGTIETITGNCGDIQTRLKYNGKPIDIRSINVGTTIGTILFTYNGFQSPDKFEVWFDGNLVVDTGYVGESGYCITPTGAASGYITFNKLTTTDHVIVKVFSPCTTAGLTAVAFWEYTVGCAVVPTTTTTTTIVTPAPTTTTTTTTTTTLSTPAPPGTTTTTTTVAPVTTTTTTTVSTPAPTTTTTTLAPVTLPPPPGTTTTTTTTAVTPAPTTTTTTLATPAPTTTTLATPAPPVCNCDGYTSDPIEYPHQCVSGALYTCNKAAACADLLSIINSNGSITVTTDNFNACYTDLISNFMLCGFAFNTVTTSVVCGIGDKGGYTNTTISLVTAAAVLEIV